MSVGIIESLIERIAKLEAEVAELRGAKTPTLVSPEDFAKSNGISISTVRAMIRDGRLPAQHVGRLVRIPSDAAIGVPIKAARR